MNPKILFGFQNMFIYYFQFGYFRLNSQYLTFMHFPLIIFISLSEDLYIFNIKNNVFIFVPIIIIYKKDGN